MPRLFCGLERRGDFVGRLRQAIDEKHLTIKEIATHLNVGPPSIYCWFRGSVSPSKKHMRALGALLNVSPMWLWIGRDDELRLNYGARLKAWRKRMGATQAQLAKFLGISRQSVHAIESGRKFPAIRHYRKIEGVVQEAREGGQPGI